MACREPRNLPAYARRPPVASASHRHHLSGDFGNRAVMVVGHMVFHTGVFQPADPAAGVAGTVSRA